MDDTMKVYLAGIVLVVIIFVAWHFQADKYNVSERYHDPEYGFSVLYPKSWEVVTEMPEGSEDVEEIVVGFRSREDDAFTENVFIWAFPSEPGTSSREDPLAFFLEDLAGVGSSFEMLEQSRRTINGRECERAMFRVHFSTQERGVFMQFLIHLVPDGNRLFVVQCAAPVIEFGRHSDVFEKVSQSFTVD